MPDLRRAVLVVDDDDDIREGICDLLESEGFVVLPARDGRSALKLLREHHPQPQLVVLDLMMPNMTGWEFREEQRRDPAISDIPVILMTAATKDFPEAVQLIRKPFSAEALIRSVKRLYPE